MIRRILPIIYNISKNRYNICQITMYGPYSYVNVSSLSTSYSYPLSIQTRTYAKGKDKKKEKGKSKKVVIDENEISEVIDYEKLKSEMSEAIGNLRYDFVHKLSLRSTTGGIDTLRFSYKGEKIDLLEVAKVNRSNPNMVIIDMFSCSHLLPTVMKVLASPSMNLNPQQDGSSIIIPVPQMTQQYKEGLAKSAKALFVKCRDIIKDCQNKYLKILKNKSKDGISEDLVHRVSEQIVFMGNTYIADAEKLLQKKQEELNS